MRKLLAFTLTVAALAQSPIEVTTRLVEITVIVRDKHGAVADLNKSDFEILDKGKARQIATFSMARAPDHAPTPPPSRYFLKSFAPAGQLSRHRYSSVV